jgi:murein DD-endopeptidase MepM/ murein hydrolase activator NlpD
MYLLEMNTMKHLMFTMVLYITSAFSISGAAPDSTLTAISMQRILPPGYVLPVPRSITWENDSIKVQLFAREFNQGNLVYMEIIPKEKITTNKEIISCTYEDTEVFLKACSWGYRGFFALPSDSSEGEKMLVLEYLQNSQPVRHVIPFSVGTTNFPVYHKSMNVGKFSDIHHASDPETQTFIMHCADKKKEVFSLQSEDLLTSVLAHPRDKHHITSQFWSTRIYKRYEIKNGKKIAQPSETKYHRGVDFRGTRGDPVYALADGRVVLAEKMYYEGNFTVIDHGNRIFSHYMHQDSILVKVGQIVKGGEMIGAVGCSGVSTGPHLHVSLVVNGTQVDPLSILPLPIRN